MASKHSTTRWPARALFALLAACALLSTHVALAEPSASERETARSLMQEGDRLRAAGDLRGALARFQSAHAIMHVPTTGLDVASTQAALGQLVEARGLAVEVMNSPARPNEPQVFVEARKSAAELAAQLDTRIPSVKALVTPAELPYTLAIDGVKLPAEAREFAYRTNPGAHEVIVEAPGYTTEKRSVTLVEGRSETLTLQLTAAAAAISPPSAAGSVPAPEPAASVAPASAPPAALQADRDPAAPGKLRATIALSVGGAALATGVVTGLMSLSKVHEIKKSCDRDSCPPSKKSAASSANTLANVANVTIPLGVIGIAYGLFELFTLPSTQKAAAKQSQVQVELTGLGAVVRGSL